MPKMPATRDDGFIHSIRDINSPVKPKFNDVTETQQFKRWFGDWQKQPNTASKVVNKDGTPKVVYHQTDADFTVFNTDNERAGRFDTETPTGIFFKTSNSDIGISGNKQMAVYLSAKNILEFKNREEAHKYWIKNIAGYKELQRQYDEIDEYYQKLYDEKEAETDAWYDEHYDEYVAGNITEQEVLKAIDEPLDNILEEWKTKQEPVAREMKNLITDYFKKSKYDGMHLEYDGTRNGVDVDTYIVFKPTQIKSATDNIGTFDGTNPDIRYQDRINLEEELSMYNLEGKWNDYIGVQKEVIGVLKKEGYFNDNQVININTGMLIRINPKGIKETLGTGKRFQALPKKLKEFKIATLRSLPNIIETATLVKDNVPNIHKENGYEFAYFSNTIQIGNDNVRVRLSVKKKIGTNLFWIHNIDEINKSSELLDPSQEMELKEIQNFDSKITHDEDGVNLYFSDRFDNEFFELFAEDNT